MELRSRLVGVMFLRVIAISVFLGATIAKGMNGEQSFWDEQKVFFELIISTYMATIIYGLLLRLWSNIQAQAVLQLVFDFVLATIICLMTGRNESLFSILYAFNVITATLLFNKYGALSAATIGSLGMAFLTVDNNYGFTSWIAWRGEETFELSRSLYVTFVNIFALFIVAGLISYLSQQLVKKGRELENKEADLHNLEELHGAIVRSIPSGVLTLDTAGKVNFVNTSACGIIGKGQWELEGRTIFEVLPEYHAVGSDGAEVKLLMDNGALKYLAIQSAALFEHNGQRAGTLILINDTTGFKRMEETIRNAERLASLGKVAASLAHEIRNPLAAIANSVELLEKGSLGTSDSATLMHILLNESDRLNILIERFLQYARPVPPRMERVDIGKLVAETIYLFRNDRDIGKGILLEERIQYGVLADADPSQMKQVLWNLLRNAAQATGPGGSIGVDVRREEGNEDAVEIRVSDSGSGVQEELINRIFEPFYTTKEGGTGLGLSISHSIVTAHGGTMQAGNVLSGGLAITLKLPLVAGNI